MVFDSLTHKDLLFKIAFHPSIYLLKKTENEKIELIHPLEILRRWVNKILSISKIPKRIRNFKRDLMDCTILANLLNILIPNMNFLGSYLNLKLFERAEKFVSLVKTSSYEGFVCEPQEIVSANETQLIKFLANLFLWKTGLSEYSKQTKTTAPTTQKKEEEQKQADTDDAFDINITHDSQSSSILEIELEVTETDTNSEFDIDEANFTSPIVFPNQPIPAIKTPTVSVMESYYDSNNPDQIFRSLSKVQSLQSNIIPKSRDHIEKIPSLLETSFSQFLPQKSYTIEQFANMRIKDLKKIDILVDKLDDFMEAFCELSFQNDRIYFQKIRSNIQAFQIAKKNYWLNNLNCSVFFRSLMWVLSSEGIPYLDKGIQKRIQNEMNVIENPDCDPALIRDSVIKILYENGIDQQVLQPIKTQLMNFFDLLTYTVFFKQELAQNLVLLLVEKFVLKKDAFIPARNVIFHQLDSFVYGLVDYIKLQNTLFHFLSFFRISHPKTTANQIINQSKKTAIGKIIRTITQRALSENSKKLVQNALSDFKQKLEINEDDQEKFQQNQEYFQMFERAKEFMNNYLLDSDVIFLTVAVDYENCLDSLDDLSAGFFHVFEHLGFLVPFIKMAISQQIIAKKNQFVLFRTNDITSKFLTRFCATNGLDYLRNTLHDVLQEICQEGLEFEVDPYIEMPQRIKENLVNLRKYFHKILDKILASANFLPLGLKIISAHIRKETNTLLHINDLTVLGSLIFLRFICPAILSPHTFNIIDVVPDSATERGLLLLSSAIQTLGTGKTFGSNRAYLQPLNEDIEKRSSEMNNFLDSISTLNGDLCLAPTFTSEASFYLARSYRILQSHNKPNQNSKFNSNQVIDSIKDFILKKQSLNSFDKESFEIQKSRYNLLIIQDKIKYLTSGIAFLKQIYIDNSISENQLKDNSSKGKITNEEIGNLSETNLHSQETKPSEDFSDSIWKTVDREGNAFLFDSNSKQWNFVYLVLKSGNLLIFTQKTSNFNEKKIDSIIINENTKLEQKKLSKNDKKKIVKKILISSEKKKLFFGFETVENWNQWLAWISQDLNN
ncbi:ras gtpase-activating protein [Anaeramoeba ignava]|uniref:Ras gtpase-activating protein n=1 Tax=Anaeramoeba ignava TaxID=1746090 RepID=A0A9Q0RDX2_ANAIG|nr:ras gtpase-activating protein [Anaeramoeba ignava]